jgi:hypothetical protein
MLYQGLILVDMLLYDVFQPYAAYSSTVPSHTRKVVLARICISTVIYMQLYLKSEGIK